MSRPVDVGDAEPGDFELGPDDDRPTRAEAQADAADLATYLKRFRPSQHPADTGRNIENEEDFRE